MPTLNIDGKKVKFDDDAQSVLDVARSAGIQIPTLCDHAELEAYGGCRLCLVEIEGWKGYAAACTTPPKDGMVIKSTSDDLTKMKRNILQLILREHPSACIVCYEWPGCLEFRTESHRAGAVTGCNTCPNREICELREVAELLETNDLDYEPEYKSIPVERDDPFFDRDYNLCILCARCVRVCDEVRGTSAITLRERGYDTRVDTAFGNSHIESGCWFCGACVDVCPTGAITPRMSKWIGSPDESIETTCALCGFGCQVEIDIKWERVMGSSPGRNESAPNHGHMCVLGRFCIPSLNNAPDRLKAPQVKQNDEVVPVSWDDAVSEVARILSEADPKKIGFLGSPQMSSESAYVLQKLARDAVKSVNVDFQGSDFPALIHSELANEKDFVRIKSLDSLENVDWIISVGGDFVKTHQVVAKIVYKAVKGGTPLTVVGETGVNLRRWATEYLPISPKKIPTTLAEMTKDGVGAILVGPEILELKEPEEVLSSLLKLAGKDGILVPLFPLGNEAGVIKAGLRTGMLPGPTSGKDGMNLTEMREKAKKGDIDVLFVLDGSIDVKGFKKVPNIIYQSPYPSDWIDLATVILPSTTFVEEDGTFVNLEMNPIKLKATVKPPSVARPDWEIISEIGKKLGASGFEFKKVDAIWKKLSTSNRNVKAGKWRRASWKPAPKGKHDWYPRYRGATIPERIQDLATFVDELPERDRPYSKESLDELVTRLEKAEEAAK